MSFNKDLDWGRIFLQWDAQSRNHFKSGHVSIPPIISYFLPLLSTTNMLQWWWWVEARTGKYRVRQMFMLPRNSSTKSITEKTSIYVVVHLRKIFLSTPGPAGVGGGVGVQHRGNVCASQLAITDSNPGNFLTNGILSLVIWENRSCFLVSGRHLSSQKSSRADLAILPWWQDSNLGRQFQSNLSWPPFPTHRWRNNHSLSFIKF